MEHHDIGDPFIWELNSLSFSNPGYDDKWAQAEARVEDLIASIKPSKPSEESRRAVIAYVEQLIEGQFDCKVFPFGSVPLKTYLPNGDIDITAISEYYPLNDSWAQEVSLLLEREEHSHASEFQVKEVRCIHAEVSVVKCLVAHMIVDISFNQLGGLSTLCFLEEVDRLIGNNHLFKRSIILIKAWCFYESRILGAHHGLLSTYALETLVLYIFHVFHPLLRGPLEVLFRFLQFFSKFDWNQYCLSLWGPIPIASLHNIPEAVGLLNNSSKPLLFDEAFLSACREKYGTCVEENQGKPFHRKFMNVIDPLRANNNLGRSISRGNFVRIHSAFAYGALQLEKLLQSSSEDLESQFTAFFRNTLSHCQGKRPDAGLLAELSVQENRDENVMRKVEMKVLENQFQPSDDGDIAMENNHVDQAYAVSLSHFKHMDFEEGNHENGAIVSKEYHLCPVSDSPDDDEIEKDKAGSSDQKPVPNITQNTSSLVVDDLAACFQDLEFTDTKAYDILDGDLASHLKNLKIGCRFQHARLHRNVFLASHHRHFNWNSDFEGAGRAAVMSGDMFSQFMGCTNEIQGIVGSHNRGPMLNGVVGETYVKLHKGTGTFFPNVRPGFERGKRFSNGARNQRKLANADNPNQNGTYGFRARSHVPKRREGQHKSKARNSSIDTQSKETQEMPITEFRLLSPDAASKDKCFFDEASSTSSLVDLPAVMIPPFSKKGNIRGVTIETLEFGSFRPGALATASQCEIPKKEKLSVRNPLASPHGTDSALAASHVRDGQATSNSHSCQSPQVSYQLNEEDFPPLTLEESGALTVPKTPTYQLSYNEACLVGHLLQ